MSLHYYGAWKLYKQKSSHAITTLLTTALTLEFASILFFFFHYFVYAFNGKGLMFSLFVARVCDMLSVLLFMLLVVLLAKGWAITTQEITHKKAIIAVMVVLVAGYIVFFIFEDIQAHSDSSTYAYATVPGIIVLVLRGLATLYFAYELINTYRKEDQEEKRRFYIIFGVIYFIWFISLPVSVIIATTLAEWYRDRVVVAIDLTITPLAYSFLAYLLWPTRAK